MEELTLKEIAGYFPYKLKVLIKDKIVELTDMHGKYSISTQPRIHGFKYCSYDEFKPLVYPLGMLTKTIVHNGVEIVPIDELKIYQGVDYLIEQIKTGLVEVIIYQKLLEWHFDVFSLLERNLAIDKSTLNSK